MIFENVTLKELPSIATEITKKLKTVTNIAFYGNLGAGKTTLIKEICKIIGGDENEVRSPTFTIINNYSWADSSIVHIDFYRLDADEAEFLGIEDYFEDTETLVFMEWPEKASEIIPKNTIKIYIDYVDVETRKIVIK